MNPKELKVTFEKFEDDYIKFEDVQNKLSQRPDIHAFILLDKLCPPRYNNEDIISASEHDEYWLAIDCEQLAGVVTEEQVQELVRCGVRYDSYNDCLAMFS